MYNLLKKITIFIFNTNIWYGVYIFYFKIHFRDRKGVLYSMYAIGAHGNAENLPNFKKASASQLTSPLHKRTRIMFDDILANAAKKGRKGHNNILFWIMHPTI